VALVLLFVPPSLKSYGSMPIKIQETLRYHCHINADLIRKSTALFFDICTL